jgi:AcrR family transcriptional regulator
MQYIRLSIEDYHLNPLSRPHKPRFGRPRDPDIEQKVVLAAIEILADHGFSGLSFAKISSLSGVARPTLKLRWRTREDLCIVTVKYLLDQPQNLQIPDDLSGHNIRDLMITVLKGLIIALNSPQTMRILSSILSAAHFSEPMGELRQYVLSRRGIVLRRLLKAGIKNGEFAKTTNIEFALDALNGPILYRTLVLGMSMNTNAATSIVNMVLPPPQ